MSVGETAKTLAQKGVIRSGSFDLGYSIEGQGLSTMVIGSSVYYPRTFSQEIRQHLRMAFIDHRGFSKPSGEQQASDYNLDRILADMELMRTELELGKVIVVGHSGHGFMALEYAKKYPDSVSHVVLIGMGPSHSAAHSQLSDRHWQEAICPERKAQLEKDLKHLPEEIAAQPEKRFITFCLRLAAKSWFDFTFDAAPLWEGVYSNMPAIDHLWGEAFRDLDITQGLTEMNKPVFLALGRFDYLVAPQWTWEPYRKNFQDLTVRIFDQSSHTPQLEEAQIFNQTLRDWLKSRSQ